MWKGCGSHWRANATISSSVTVWVPSSTTWPASRSSKYSSDTRTAYGARLAAEQLWKETPQIALVRNEPIATRSSVQDVAHSIAAHDQVVAAGPEQSVLPATSVDAVVPVAADDDVGSRARANRVIAGEGTDHVCARGSAQQVRPGRSLDRANRLPCRSPLGRIDRSEP